VLAVGQHHPADRDLIHFSTVGRPDQNSSISIVRVDSSAMFSSSSFVTSICGAVDDESRRRAAGCRNQTGRCGGGPQIRLTRPEHRSFRELLLP
jgi:hypothetical protein